MRTEQALSLVNALADGLDPISNRPLPSDSPSTQPDCVRALLMAARALENRLAHETRLAKLPARSGLPWDEAEDNRLAVAFDADADLAALAQLHERSRAAVAARLVKLGKLAPDQTRTRFRVD